MAGEIESVSTLHYSLQLYGVAYRPDYKRTIYIVLLVIYGSLALPSAALKGYTIGYFNTCAALYTVFAIFGFISVAWQNIFIPIIMRGAAPVETARDIDVSDEEQLAISNRAYDNLNITALREKRDRAGLTTSAWGLTAMNGGAALVFVITIALTFANEEAALYGGLYMSTATAAACIVLALSVGPFLPRAERVVVPRVSDFWKLPFTTCTLLPSVQECCVANTLSH